MTDEIVQNNLFDTQKKKLVLTKKDRNSDDFLVYKYATCLVNIKNMGVKTFSYLIPDSMQNIIQIGHALLVPFGKSRFVNAFCVGFTNYIPDNIRAKKIIKILNDKPLFSVEYLKVLEWVADYYCSDLITVLNAAMPLNLLEKSLKHEYVVEFIKSDNVSKRQLEVLNFLKSYGKMNLTQFINLAKTTRATLKKLEENGCIKLSECAIYRNPLSILNIDKKENIYSLSDLQLNIYNGIKSKFNKLNSPEILLHGVTASGKTEIYFKLIDDVIKKGKNVLFLVPEIALASQLTKRLAKKFGIEDVAIWHSSISEGERYDVWDKLYKNKIKILAGARSAVFAPLKNIGLIIIDEEHESAYKQSTPAPRYDARLVAKKLSQFYNCPLLLGSATPDITSYYRAKNSNNLFQLLERYNNAKVPPVTVINMQEYRQAAYKGLISKPLQVAIKDTLDNHKQVILLINRRGFSTTSQCEACGTVLECPNCAIPMIWHSQDKMLKCHYCNHSQYFPDACPSCGSDSFKTYGVGTQKIELYIKELFPEYSVKRIDSDTLSRKGEHVRVLDQFSSGKIDILVGTQMIAKGLDNPNVTLVGVISADASFNLPDYRSSERGFQLLTQVAGRAGRGEFSGRVYFQTYNPEYYALESAKTQNYSAFYEKEIISRQDFEYPPFSQIIRIIFQSQNKFRAEKAAMEVVMRLNTLIDKYGIMERLDVLGPTPCVIERINAYWRFQLIIKNRLEDKGHQFLSSFFKKIKNPNDIKILIDVDPIDIL